MLAILFLALGLLILILANIALGAVKSLFAQQFEWKKFWQGFTKGGIILVCLVAVWFAGYLNPDIAAVEINGQAVTLTMAVYLVVLSAYIWYAGQVIIKIVQILRGKLVISTIPEKLLPDDEFIERQHDIENTA